uniref:gap junction delta-3 protein-like n=1 Tax=Myxine glutinosa TaxID=7769 RepID=UPI00358ED2C8
MGELNSLGDFLGTINTHSTMLGRLWLSIFIFCRIVVIGTVGDNLYEDEQEQFVCNTLQPGCNQVCYDQAFPISQYRFWVFQIVMMSIPVMTFLAYSIHIDEKVKAERENNTCPDELGEPEKAQRWIRKRQHRTRQAYIFHVFVKLLLEIGGLLSHYYIYGFTMGAHYTCVRFPCPHEVDCFVSRPAEKTIFLLYYFSVNILSAFICFIELQWLGIKKLKHFLNARYTVHNPETEDSMTPLHKYNAQNYTNVTLESKTEVNKTQTLADTYGHGGTADYNGGLAEEHGGARDSAAHYV